MLVELDLLKLVNSMTARRFKNGALAENAAEKATPSGISALLEPRHHKPQSQQHEPEILMEVILDGDVITFNMSTISASVGVEHHQRAKSSGHHAMLE